MTKSKSKDIFSTNFSAFAELFQKFNYFFKLIVKNAK